MIQSASSAARNCGLVVLAGAGVSMAPPSSLPSWSELNRMVLDALMRRLGDYTERREELEELFALLIERRDRQSIFPPEYQAQVMEEQVGATYFRSLQAVDVPQRNAAHETLAVLAASGLLKAIVTTNFDRLIESALEGRDVPHTVHIEPEGYEALAAALEQDTVEHLPVVKIHGSVEDEASLVDTLRQRQRGRGAALESALRQLLQRHYWAFCGFSGADLDFDPNYLGLRAAAATCPGFVFVHRPGDTPRSSVRDLAKAYGDKATFVAATLEEWLAALCHDLGVARPPAPPAEVTDPRGEVVDRLDRWANSLLPMEAVNTCSALLEAGGQEPAALWLLRKTWKWFRTPDDTSGPPYARFLVNYGRVALAEGDEQDGETIQNFLRTTKDLPEALAYAGLYFAYMGERAQALGFFGAAAERAEADTASVKGELALAVARYGRVYGGHEDVLKTIYWALSAVEEDGDLPRRARLLAAAARIWAAAGVTEEATKAIAASLPLAERIGDTILVAEIALARGLVHFADGQYDRAQEELRGAAETFAQFNRLPLYLDAALEWIEAAYMARDDDEAWEVYQSAESQLITAYAPRLYLIMGRWYAARGQLDDARRNLDRAAQEAERQDNEWMRKAVEGTLAQLPSS